MPLLLPQIALLAIVEHMQPTCGHYIAVMPSTSTFDYAGVRIVFINHFSNPLGYHDACTALRGLAEYMVLKNAFNVWMFDIRIRGSNAGSGRILLSQSSLSASPSDVDTS